MPRWRGGGAEPHRGRQPQREFRFQASSRRRNVANPVTGLFKFHPDLFDPIRRHTIPYADCFDCERAENNSAVVYFVEQQLTRHTIGIG